jgi:outer membrane protein TolC
MWIKPKYFQVLNSYRRQLLIVTFLLFQMAGFSQIDNGVDLMKDNIESMLPPLGKIIDSAILLNPYIKYRDLQVRINQYSLKISRKQWTNNLGIDTDVRYGTFDNFSTNTTGGQTPDLMATRSNQLNYGIGAFLKIPIGDIINRKSQINMAKTNVEQAASMADVQRNEFRQLIIKQYNDLVLKQRYLKIRLKTFETSKINFEMVETKFRNGIVPVDEYSRISDMTSKAEEEFEASRIEYITAFMLLEEIVGFKFNLTKKNN